MGAKKDKMQEQPVRPAFPHRKRIRALQLEISEDLFDQIEETCKRLGITKKEFAVYGIEKALLEAKNRKA